MRSIPHKGARAIAGACACIAVFAAGYHVYDQQTDIESELREGSRLIACLESGIEILRDAARCGRIRGERFTSSEADRQAIRESFVQRGLAVDEDLMIGDRRRIRVAIPDAKSVAFLLRGGEGGSRIIDARCNYAGRDIEIAARLDGAGLAFDRAQTSGSSDGVTHEDR
ncbi:MAG: hypothetical protein H6832_02330 [Planctomycetes bacterium]|nr:hypothetical protein [Planctomycetota bacterium]MCB9917227.1 hypothetical protein [Planctomycetota bacterium]